MYAPRFENQVPSKPLPVFSIHEESNENSNPLSGLDPPETPLESSNALPDLKERAMPLTTSAKANQQPQATVKSDSVLNVKHNNYSRRHDMEGSPCRNAALMQYFNAPDKSPVAAQGDKGFLNIDVLKSSTSDEVSQDTPAFLTYSKSETEEVNRLKQELEAAQSKIARMDEELLHSRMATHSIQAAPTRLLGEHARPSETPDQWPRQQAMTDSSDTVPIAERPSQHLPSLATSRGPSPNVAASWNEPSAYSRCKDVFRPLPSGRGGWDSYSMPPMSAIDSNPEHISTTLAKRPSVNVGHLNGQFFTSQHGFSVPIASRDTEPRRNSFHFLRPASTLSTGPNDWSSYSTSTVSTPRISPPITPLPLAVQRQVHPQVAYHPRPIGTPLSPTALEFSAAAMSSQGPISGGFWNEHYSPDEMTGSGTHLNHVEPINYRRLLDKNMSCNWRYIVDKIVCSNDQQASIFLQQKLKVATPEQKFELIEAIIAQAYALMINRFGNFLVQRCFEHGTPEQVIAIANAIRGNTLTLSMDAFGCHVVQKAFDAVPEEYKAIMVHELLRRIPETVIHRYACHVWQKLFELRWSDSPPQIMKYVNEALRGMWHEVALGETGSLVVQNIFENCLEEDKRPCINEVLASIDIVSHGQFGNWCIQHICEHGSLKDKNCAIEHVLRFATEYSTDQFASKVVEKCLKVGGTDFLQRYLERVCEGRPDRPRMPLIDIAGDQYGNYLIQHILINAETEHREIVAQHVRKHMVSLRGSKFGSRVAMLCSNPAFCTRPGPPTSMVGGHRYFNANSSATHGGFARADLTGHYR